MLKKVWVQVILFIFIILTVVTLYFYSHHTVMIKTCNINEYVELGGVKMIIDEIKIYNYERKYGREDKKISLRKIIWENTPQRLKLTFLRLSFFYSTPYVSLRDSSNISLKGKLILDSAEEDESASKMLTDRFEFKILDDLDYNFWYSDGSGKRFSSGYSYTGNQNIISFEIEGKKFPKGKEHDIKNILITDKVTDNTHLIQIKEPFTNRYYNYFQIKPRTDDNNPLDSVGHFLRVLKNKGKEEAKTYVLTDLREGFNWDNLNNSYIKERDFDKSFLKYEGKVLDLEKVYSVKVSFSVTEEDCQIAQKLYLINRDCKWYIIDVSPIEKQEQ